MDTKGDWHGDKNDFRTARYNVLLADGHAKNMLFLPMIKTWLLPLRAEEASLSDKPAEE